MESYNDSVDCVDCGLSRRTFRYDDRVRKWISLIDVSGNMALIVCYMQGFTSILLQKIESFISGRRCSHVKWETIPRRMMADSPNWCEKDQTFGDSALQFHFVHSWLRTGGVYRLMFLRNSISIERWIRVAGRSVELASLQLIGYLNW